MPTDDATRTTKDDHPRKEGAGRIAGATVYFVAAGLVLLGAACWAIVEGSDTAAASLVVLGGGALVLAPFAPNIEGTLKLGSLEVPIRRRVVGAVATASPESLEAVLSILESKDFGVEAIPLPPKYATQTLKEGKDLKRWRPDRGLSVIAIRNPRARDWTAGGVITDTPLEEGTTLLVSGPREELDRLRRE